MNAYHISPVAGLNSTAFNMRENDWYKLATH